MADIFTKKKRSEIMSKIKGKWTKPERFAHHALKCAGVRHRMHPKMDVNPDILIPGKRICIFIDGCFWHKCPRHYREPKTNRKYWLPKMDANAARDRRTSRRLRRKGYGVRRIWECRLSSARLLAAAGAA